MTEIDPIDKQPGEYRMSMIGRFIVDPAILQREGKALFLQFSTWLNIMVY